MGSSLLMPEVVMEVMVASVVTVRKDYKAWVGRKLQDPLMVLMVIRVVKVEMEEMEAMELVEAKVVLSR